jgi:hypothetical protein
MAFSTILPAIFIASRIKSNQCVEPGRIDLNFLPDKSGQQLGFWNKSGYQ